MFLELSMYKSIVLSIGLIVGLLLFGCDPSSNATTNDAASLLAIKGGWDFADQGGMTNITVGIFPDESDATRNTGSADIDWHQDTLSFSCTGNGGSYSERFLSEHITNSAKITQIAVLPIHKVI
jgi:hypothetical protein